MDSPKLRRITGPKSKGLVLTLCEIHTRYLSLSMRIKKGAQSKQNASTQMLIKPPCCFFSFPGVGCKRCPRMAHQQGTDEYASRHPQERPQEAGTEEGRVNHSVVPTHA